MNSRQQSRTTIANDYASSVAKRENLKGDGEDAGGKRREVRDGKGGETSREAGERDGGNADGEAGGEVRDADGKTSRETGNGDGGEADGERGGERDVITLEDATQAAEEARGEDTSQAAEEASEEAGREQATWEDTSGQEAGGSCYRVAGQAKYSLKRV